LKDQKQHLNMSKLA